MNPVLIAISQIGKSVSFSNFSAFESLKSIRYLGAFLYHVVVDIDPFPVGPQRAKAHVVEDVDIVLVSNNASAQIVDPASELGTTSLSNDQEDK